MLNLDLPTKPYWLDLPRGVRVEIRPITTAVMAAAQAGSARRLGALRASEADLDPDMARGLAFAFLVKTPARHAVTAWEGIGDTAGKPLPLSPEAAKRLMDMDDTPGEQFRLMGSVVFGENVSGYSFGIGMSF